jgi:hypothetical protein
MCRDLENGLADILLFNCGRRPLIGSEASLWRLVFSRFEAL